MYDAGPHEMRVSEQIWGHFQAGFREGAKAVARKSCPAQRSSLEPVTSPFSRLCYGERLSPSIRKHVS